jgi:hypothetical protein
MIQYCCRIVAYLCIFSTIKGKGFVYFEVIFIRLILASLKEIIDFMVYSRVNIQIMNDSH